MNNLTHHYDENLMNCLNDSEYLKIENKVNNYIILCVLYVIALMSTNSCNLLSFRIYVCFLDLMYAKINSYRIC